MIKGENLTTMKLSAGRQADKQAQSRGWMEPLAILHVASNLYGPYPYNS